MEGGGDGTALQLAAAMSGYESAIALMEDQTGDKCAQLFLQRRKHDMSRLLRGTDPQLLERLETERKEQQARLKAMHRELYQQDRRRQAEADKTKAAKQKEEALKEAKRVRKQQLHDLSMGTDRAWLPADFGLNDKFSADHRRNIREAMIRIKMRAPELPIELEANWTVFIDQFPRRLREVYGPKTGAYLLARLARILDDLGKYAVSDPALPNKKTRSASEGDPTAFEKFLREQMKLKVLGGAVYF